MNSKTKTFKEMSKEELLEASGKVFEPVAQPKIWNCQHCHKDSVKLYEFENGWFCDACATGKNSDEEDIPIMEELMDMEHVAKPDFTRHVAIEQPDGSAFITDNVQAEMTCKCGKSKLWMHAGQISTPCPYCRRQYLAVHHPKKGMFKFIHYNAWWRRWLYLILRGPAI